ncbi:MAG: F0F1 ATP synthase subunit delta [Pseudomonadota bacterium]
MAEITTIARPYAEAVFKLAAQQGELSKWASVLAEMAAIANNPDMRSAIGNPKITDSKLAELFLSVVKSPLNEDAKSFVQVLIDNNRLSLLPQVSAQFDKLKSEREGIAEAEVISAFPMSDAELGSLTASLEKRFKRKIKPTVRIDKELIGGVKVIVGDEVLDASVRARLQSMATTLQS